MQKGRQRVLPNSRISLTEEREIIAAVKAEKEKAEKH